MTWTPRLDRREAEQLLDGGSDASRTARVLNAARRPATADELAREDATVALFHHARLEGRVAGTVGDAARPARFGGVGAVKAIAAAVAMVVFASTGIALAAGQRAPWSDPSAPAGDPRSAGSIADNDQADDTAGTDAGASGDETHRSSPGEAGDPSTDEGIRPGLRGLCTAVLAGTKGENGHALEAPRFAGLVEAAGGFENVSAYCRAHLAESGGAMEPDDPGKPGGPDKPDKPDKPGRPDEPGRPENPGQSGRPDRPGRPDNPGKSDSAGTPDPGRAGNQGKPERQAAAPGGPGRPDDPGGRSGPENPDQT